MGWDVAIHGTLRFSSVSDAKRWHAAKLTSLNEGPAEFCGRPRARSVKSALGAELELGGDHATYQTVLDEDAYRERRAGIAAAFACAHRHAGQGDLVFVGLGVELEHRLRVSAKGVAFVALRASDRKRAESVRSAAERELIEAHPELSPILEQFDADVERLQKRWAKTEAKAEKELEHELASSKDPHASLIGMLSAKGRGASAKAELATERLRAGNRRTVARVLQELDAYIAKGKTLGPLPQRLLKALGKADPHARDVLLAVFRNPRYGWVAQIAAGQTLLSAFGEADDGERFGGANLPTLRERIDVLFPG